MIEVILQNFGYKLFDTVSNNKVILSLKAINVIQYVIFAYT